jgi:hypothetical protein
MRIIQGFLLLFIGMAIGTAVWFGVLRDVHYFRRDVSLEDRKAAAVGASQPLRKPIEVKITNNPKFCIQIEQVELDGSDMVLYFRNACDGAVRYAEFHWKGIAPDGTVIFSQWTNQTHIESGRTELSYPYVKRDPRTAVFEIRATGNI